MSRPLWTGSESEHVIACPASAVLTRSGESTAPAEGGHSMADFLAATEKVDRAAALAAAPEADREFLSRIELDELRLPPGAWAAEVTFVLDLETGTAFELGRKLGRGYARALGRPFKSSEVVVTVDLVALRDDAVVVMDDKRGWAAHVPPVRRCWQVLTGGLAASLAYQRSSAHVGVARVMDDGVPKFDSALLDEMDLDLVLHELRQTRSKVERARALLAAGGNVETRWGDHCRYCPCLVSCPSHLNVLRELAQPGADLISQLPETDDELAFIYDKWKRGRAILEKLGDALRARAAQRAFATTSGKWFGERLKEGLPVYDGKKTHDLLEKRFGAERAKKAVTMETSGTAITEALRDLPEADGGAPKRGWTKWRDQLTAELTAAGAMSRKADRYQVEEFSASREKVEAMLAERHRRRLEAEELEGRQLEHKLAASLEQPVEAPPPEPPSAQAVDLMEALKSSLAPAPPADQAEELELP